MPSSNAPFLDNPGPVFHGSTAYSATLFESQLAADNDDEQSNGIQRVTHDDVLSPWNKLSYTPDRFSQVQRGQQCLALLREMPTLEYLVESWFRDSHSFHLSAPWLMLCLDTLKSRIASTLNGLSASQTERFLMQCSFDIFQCTLRPIEPPKSCTPRQYAAAWITINLRWEALAAVFTAAGIAAVACHQRQQPDLQLPKGKIHIPPHLGKQMLDAASTCLSFCAEIGNLSDPELWLLVDTGFLASLVDGDNSNLTWRLNGDLASAVVARGLHHDIGSGIHDPQVPVWLREMRKRTFAAAYGLSIGLASFTGRPPSLLKRYCDISYPLDIPMKYLAEIDFDFTDLASRVDARGWNTDDHVEGAALLRAGLTLNMVREDIIDFALTATSQIRDPDRTASDIYHSCQQVWEFLPPFLKLSNSTSIISNDFVIPRLQSQLHLPWGPTTTYLNHLYNLLLLERAAIRHIRTRSKNSLIQTSRIIISTMLDLLQPPSKQSALSTTATSTAITNPWIIVKYGVPASGVLCLELLLERQRCMRGQTVTNANGQGEEACLGQFRSEVIQNLSRFVRCLDSHVTPFHGNYQICRQSRTLIRRILDKILDPVGSPEDHLAQHQHHNGYQEQNFDPMLQQQQQQEYGERQQPLSEMEFWEKTLPNHLLLRDE